MRLKIVILLSILIFGRCSYSQDVTMQTWQQIKKTELGSKESMQNLAQFIKTTEMSIKEKEGIANRTVQFSGGITA